MTRKAVPKCPERGADLNSERDLRLLAEVFARLHQTHDTPDHLLIVAGWTIFAAAEAQLFGSVFDLLPLLTPPALAAMRQGKRISLGEPPAPPGASSEAVTRVWLGWNFQGSLGLERARAEHLDAIERGVPDLADCIDQDGCIPLVNFDSIPKDKAMYAMAVGEIHAPRIVDIAWSFLAARNANQMSGDAALAYLAQRSTGKVLRDSRFVRASWVCDFLSNVIAATMAGVNNKLGMTVTDAASFVGCSPGTITRACDRGDILTNGARQRGRRLVAYSVQAFKEQHMLKNKLTVGKEEQMEAEFRARAAELRVKRLEDELDKAKRDYHPRSAD